MSGPEVRTLDGPLRPDATRHLRILFWLCVAIAVLRLVSLFLFPLIDRTESRYGEIARQMAVSGDWITPRINGQPFWGKPPLSTWCQAASVHVFGANEFAVRFPGWIVTVLIGCLVWRVARLWLGTRTAWVAAAVFAGAPLSIGMAGATMTDPYLVLGIAIALWSLARWCAPGARSPSGWSTAALYGGGLAVGVLAKGPLAVVLGGAPLLALCLTRTGRSDLKGWPWVRAIIVFLALSVPWFAAAEVRTPGFLRYFFVGEHWHRFVQPKWTGDLYGGTHPTSKGMVWVFFFVGFITWIVAVVHAWLTRRSRSTHGASFTLVLWVSLLSPLVLFSFAGSVLLPYAFPAIPAACVLLSRTLQPQSAIHALSTAAVICLLAVICLPFVPSDAWAKLSHRPMVTGSDVDCVVYCRRIDTIYSAQFYTQGRAVFVGDLTPQDWDALRAKLERVRFVTKKRRIMEHVPEDIRSRLVVERDFDGYYQVWRPQD